MVSTWVLNTSVGLSLLSVCLSACPPQVPQMSAFLLMTIFPQMPCVAFLTLFQEHIFPVDRAAGWIMFVFLVRWSAVLRLKALIHDH